MIFDKIEKNGMGWPVALMGVYGLGGKTGGKETTREK